MKWRWNSFHGIVDTPDRDYSSFPILYSVLDHIKAPPGNATFDEKHTDLVELSMKCLYVTASSFHVEVEMRVQSNEQLDGQYFTSTGTQGNLPWLSGAFILPIFCGQV